MIKTWDWVRPPPPSLVQKTKFFKKSKLEAPLSLSQMTPPLRKPETITTERKDVKVEKCHFILLSIILSFPHENPQVDKTSSHFIMGKGINGFITGILRLQS